eukprot:1622949-Alexandrium_andersonii.AAC.1
MTVCTEDVKSRRPATVNAAAGCAVAPAIDGVPQGLPWHTALSCPCRRCAMVFAVAHCAVAPA